MRRVTPRKPCVICGHDSWCTRSDDGGVSVCMRSPSPKAAKNGGWVHVHNAMRPNRREKTPEPDRGYPTTPPAFSRPEGVACCDRALGELIGAVPHGFSEEYDVVYNKHFYFAMRWPGYGVCGWRVRSRSGRKWAITGSRSGLFMPARAPVGKLAVVVEGPTDTLACWYALSGHRDVTVVGRPDARSVRHELWKYLGRFERVLIIADNDPVGFMGARELARTLLVPRRVVWFDDVKDAREFLRKNGAAELRNWIMKQARWASLA